MDTRRFGRRAARAASFLLLAGAAASQQIVSTSGAIIQDAAFGQQLLAAGDVNGDGFADYIAMSQATSNIPFYWPIGHVVSGKTGVKLHTIHPPIVIPPASIHDGEGLEVVPAGDLDGDGGIDIAVMRPASAVLMPLAYVFSGKTGATLLDLNGLDGLKIARADDFDGDGAADLILSLGGPAIVVSGATHLPIAGLAASGIALGDLNGDGRSELAISDGANGTNVVTGPSGALLFAYPSLHVAGAYGDYDHDGFVDFDTYDGTVTHIVSGKTGAALATFTGPANGIRLRDVDVDGTPDYVVQHLGMGLDEIVSASASLVMTLPLLPLDTPPLVHPRRYAGIGDADGDGVPDLAVADLQGNNGFGAVYVLSLAPTSTTPHGTGTPGCVGAHHLVADEAPHVGAAGFGFRADAAPSLSLGSCVISSAAAPMGYLGFLGISVLVDLGASEVFAFSMPSNALGFALASIPLPAVPALVGNAYEAQALFPWTTCAPSPVLLSTTPAVHFVVMP